MTSDSKSDQLTHTCTNCFAEFDWSPSIDDGDVFCCFGCTQGGPCVCTYERSEESAGGGAVVAPVVLESGEDEEQSESEETPGTAAYRDDKPVNGRLEIIMAAVGEMPIPVQRVVRERITNPGTDEEVAESLEMSVEEARGMIEQGQAILDRAIGADFRIQYIEPEDAGESQQPESLILDDSIDVDETELPDAADQDVEKLLAQSMSELAEVASDQSQTDPRSREVLSETLLEIGNLLRIASKRLTTEKTMDESPLREALADTRGADEPVTLVVVEPADVAPFFMALQQSDSVQWAKIERQTDARTEFKLVVGSMMSLVRDLMALEGSLRPTRMQMSGDRITIELPSGAVADASSEATESSETPPAYRTSTNGSHPEHRFEMLIESFFGARHFIVTDDSVGLPHHHSYRIEASFVTSEPSNNGFVLGFANVREVVDSAVLMYSETLLNTQEPFMEVPPTTENLARVFFDQIAERLGELDVPSVALERIRVWESPTNSAAYSGPIANRKTGARQNAPIAS